ncbi:hypothetical protein HanPSC8_Chr17g0781531 [Helianthus annuus]|nr:hypothetical protein HanPSC8_Chr17g0781531 [Helianthus annuus]
MGVICWLLVHFQLHIKHLMWHWFIEPTSNMANPFLDNHTNLCFKFDYFFSALFFTKTSIENYYSLDF